MDVKITSFTNPFSFFCTTDGHDKAAAAVKLTSLPERNILANKTEIAKLVHGQVRCIPLYERTSVKRNYERINVLGFSKGSFLYLYGAARSKLEYVAVYWKNTWHRGIVNMESQFLIWLIDYGMHIKFNDKTVCVDLAPEFKKIPTKIFEASLHGIMPVVKTVSSNFSELENRLCTDWAQAAITYSQQLIDSAAKITMVPVALLNLKHNEIVLGDLYLHVPGRGLINLAEELQNAPIFLQMNAEIYIQNLPKIYVTRRRHRACTLKPNIPSEIPTITLSVELEEYSAICAKVPKLQLIPEIDYASEGSTVSGIKPNTVYKLTSKEIEEYANLYVDICGTEYNLLNLLLNKIEDLNMCEKYVKYEGKGVGRGFSRNSYFSESDS